MNRVRSKREESVLSGLVSGGGCGGKRSRRERERGGQDRVALSSLMNIQFCLVRPLAGSADVVTPAAGPVTIITITRGNRRTVPARLLAPRNFPPVSLYLQILPGTR